LTAYLLALGIAQDDLGQLALGVQLTVATRTGGHVHRDGAAD
jgi:hypothetical protein